MTPNLETKTDVPKFVELKIDAPADGFYFEKTLKKVEADKELKNETITDEELKNKMAETSDGASLEISTLKLTPEQALMIAQRPYLAAIYIKELNTIDTLTAINLANTRVKELYLDDITYLSEEQVKGVSNRMGTKGGLAYYGGDVLSLDGLTKVDDGVFKALLEAKCMSCRVRNLVLTPNQKAMYNQARKEAQKAGGAVPLVLNYELNSIVV